MLFQASRDTRAPTVRDCVVAASIMQQLPNSGNTRPKKAPKASGSSASSSYTYVSAMNVPPYITLPEMGIPQPMTPLIPQPATPPFLHEGRVHREVVLQIKSCFL